MMAGCIEMFVSGDLLVSGDENGRVVVTNLNNFSLAKPLR